MKAQRTTRAYDAPASPEPIDYTVTTVTPSTRHDSITPACPPRARQPHPEPPSAEHPQRGPLGRRERAPHEYISSIPRKHHKSVQKPRGGAVPSHKRHLIVVETGVCPGRGARGNASHSPTPVGAKRDSDKDRAFGLPAYPQSPVRAHTCDTTV